MPTIPRVSEMENALLRMQEDIRRALQKPVAERHWVMVIDLTKCVGCNACTVSCKSENKTPPEVAYNIVLEQEIGDYPNVRRTFLPRPCMHCENPPCVAVCPVGATYKRDDGIVAIDYDACIGCRYCIAACPYGARQADFGETYTGATPNPQAYEAASVFEYGDERQRKDGASPVGNARKCHFCLHRLNEGLLPSCITDCIGRARYFGDLNDPDSIVSELLGQHQAFRLKEELGTNPSVYYIS